MMMNPLVSCERVCLSYDGLRQAVAELSFEVQAGSIFALVGPNGAGKTSTLRMLATLADPTSGHIRIDGIDANEDAEGVRRRVGYLPDNFALYDAMTPLFEPRSKAVALKEKKAAKPPRPQAKARTPRRAAQKKTEKA